MNDYKQKIFIALVVSVVMAVVLNFYETYIDSAKYNTERGYIDNLDEISYVYNNMNDFVVHIELAGFVKIDENVYERSYNKFMCEKVIIDGDDVAFNISDSCMSVYENEIKYDFDNDGVNILYYVDSKGENAFLRKSGSSNSFQQYNLKTGQFEIEGYVYNEYEIVKYNTAYGLFIKQINAMMF